MVTIPYPKTLICLFIVFILSYFIITEKFESNISNYDTIRYFNSQKTATNDYMFVEKNVTATQNKSDTKIVRFECIKKPCGGWADRLKGILNTYAWSLLTNRSLEINIKHPCLIYHVLDTNKIDWYKTDKEIEGEKNRTHFIINDHVDRSFTRQMHELDVIEFGKNADIIVILTNLDWLIGFSRNKKIEKRIRELGYEPNKFRVPYLLKEMYSKLFQLQPHMDSLYRNFLAKAKSNHDAKLICVQYRVQFSLLENMNRVFNFVKSKFIDTLNTGTKYKLFITTEVKQVEEEATNFFGEQNIVKTEGEFEHFDDTDTIVDDCYRIQKTILDFHILQNCDMAVISDSGFGKLGLWNRKAPSKDLFIFKKINEEYKFIKMDMDDLSILP